MISFDDLEAGAASTFEKIGLGVDGAITAFRLPIRLAEFHPGLFQATGIACPEEIARSVPKRQAEYFYGRLCARQALHALGITGHVLATGRTREPLWPAGVTGSITHNNAFAAAVALRQAPYAGIGIDIESRFDPPKREAVVAMALTAQEYALLSLNNDIEPDLALLIAFSAKESFFKATFNTVGAYFDFDAVAVTAISARRKMISLEVAYDLCPQFKRGTTVQVCFDLLDRDTVMTGFWW